MFNTEISFFTRVREKLNLKSISCFLYVLGFLRILYSVVFEWASDFDLHPLGLCFCGLTIISKSSCCLFVFGFPTDLKFCSFFGRQILHTQCSKKWKNVQLHIFSKTLILGFATSQNCSLNTVWSEGILYKVAPPEFKNFTRHVFFHVQFNGLVKNSQDYCAISVKFLKNNILLYKID